MRAFNSNEGTSKTEKLEFAAKAHPSKVQQDCYIHVGFFSKQYLSP